MSPATTSSTSSTTSTTAAARLLGLLLLTLSLVATGCASDDADDDPVAASPATAGEVDAAGYSAEVVLSGTAEVPGPGSAGTGAATFSITGDQACLEGEVADVGGISAGHVHSGGPAESGGVVVDLGVSAEDGVPFESCATIDADLAAQIAQTPAAFYVNLHNAEFPDGAVRAQLS